LTRELFVESVSIRSFRNIDRADLEFRSGIVVISGANGQGKTNLLEAVYCVATSRSFRVSRPGELVRYGEASASIRATIFARGERRLQSLGLKDGVRSGKLNGKRPLSLGAYAAQTPVVLFHPGDLSVTLGGGSERRQLLDRISFYRAPTSSVARQRYSAALRGRKKALAERGSGGRDVGAWEDLMVRYGLEVRQDRSASAELLRAAALPAFLRMAPSEWTLDVRYSPGLPADPAAFGRALLQARESDARRGSPSVGPHRDDLTLALSGRPLRGVASQGQHRAVVLALKAAEMEVVSTERELRPILLLDDVSSELDRERTAALFAYLQHLEGQVFLSTTRPELIDLVGTGTAPRVDFEVRQGVISPL
jgi:DNA replication and repair protein RecF